MIFFLRSLLNKVSWVPSSAKVFECPNAQELCVLKCQSTQVLWVLPSALVVPFECSSDLWVSLECPLSFQVSFSSVLWLWGKNVCNITGSGFLKSLIEFSKNFSECIFCTMHILHYSLEIRCVNFTTLCL